VIRRLLIANRGEIARRVIATCRRRDIEAVAVASDVDLDAPHAREADAVVHLPGRSAAETYLDVDALLAAAHAAGADAVHPGYGFLSESAAFARAVVAAGLTWIGPPADAIAAMGSKVEAKKLLADAGVPVLAELDPQAVTAEQLPVLIKASAGGGGRGMRIVHDIDALADEVAAARREAEAAFGDPTVFCEPYLERGRHIEVQVLADAHGTVWSLGERECSAQRRHQKVLEEAPSPLVGEDLRARLGEAACDAARAVGYVGAGTVEFLATEDGRFFFLEMNTRLQVEHPVTECCTGLDLVAEQVRIAEGGRLVGEPPGLEGHAIEVRLYAEDPTANWAATSGTVHRFEIPDVTARFDVPARHGIRLDSGVEDGSEVSAFYDPMLAKVIVHAPDRQTAARHLAGVLARARIHGPRTNRDLLVRLLRHPAFLAGEVDTGFLEREDPAVLGRPLADEHAVAVSSLAAAVTATEADRRRAPVPDAPTGWRNVASQPERHVYRHGDEEIEISFWRTRDGIEVTDGPDVALVEVSPTTVVLADAGLRRRFDVTVHGRTVVVDSPLGAVDLEMVPRFGEVGAQAEPGSLLAPMPGSVVQVAAEPGQPVTTGDVVVVLEAMKMEHTIRAPHDGTVRTVAVSAGEQVERGTVLAVVEADELDGAGAQEDV
jgi:propionyl-CoA carboxylase alpha chain